MALAQLTAGGTARLYVQREESAAQIRLRAERLSGGTPLAIPVIWRETIARGAGHPGGGEAGGVP